jgi:diguanylate cyclase
MEHRMPVARDIPVARPDSYPATRLQALPKRTYRFRILGMGLAALPMVVVLREIDAAWPAWAWMVFSCFVWPHLAYLLARRSADPFRAELRNFVTDSMIAGSWVPLLHFNLLPSVVLLTVVTADKVNSGVRLLWLRSLPGMLLALLGTGLLTGFAMQVETSQAVMLACLPIMVIHTLAVSLSSYRLVRRVQRQNLQLDEISRVDALTALASRGYWLQQAEALLAHSQAEGRPAALMLVDVDRFKGINDQHGHAVGDDVLRGIAEVIRDIVRDEDHAGRLGGDEFVVALPTTLAQAQAIAERIRVGVESLRFPRLPTLVCSISIGLAEPPQASLGLREWIEAADRALYRAKRAGRNRTEGVPELASGS